MTKVHSFLWQNSSMDVDDDDYYLNAILRFRFITHVK